MNCQPYNKVVEDSTAMRASPFFVEVAFILYCKHGLAWGRLRESQVALRRAVEQDDARYMEAVRR